MELERPQSRPHWLLLIYSFQFTSAFRAASARLPRQLSSHHRPIPELTCGFNSSIDKNDGCNSVNNDAAVHRSMLNCIYLILRSQHLDMKIKRYIWYIKSNVRNSTSGHVT